MACNNCNDGCGGGITTNKLLSKEGLQHILDTLSGKLFTIWGSLKVQATAPLHLEKTYGDGGETIVEGYIDEAGKDEEGNYTSGVMSKEDKEKLDSLEKYENATEESDGLMSKEDKTALDNLSAEIRIEVSCRTVVFTSTVMRKMVDITAYKGGEQIDIEDFTPPVLPVGAGFGVSESIADGILTLTIVRTYALSVIHDSFEIGFTVNNTIYKEAISVMSADPSINVLQGFVNPLYSSTQMEADLWTFDGSVPTVRFVRDGSYWVNLPTQWAEHLGEYNKARLNVHVSMGGQNVGHQVFCGRYSPGETYGEDTASTDCWGAVLILTRDGDNNRVNDTFFITISYVPAITECYAEREYATEGASTVEYDTPTAELSYDAVSRNGGTTYAKYSYSQAWALDGVSQTPLTTGATVLFEITQTMVTDYYDVTIDETTGAVTATHKGDVLPAVGTELCTVKMSVTMNGKTCEATASVVTGNETTVG